MMLVAGIAALYDIRTWKIPNWLILLGLETGILSPFGRMEFVSEVFVYLQGYGFQSVFCM